jgi:hypothetical protein
MWSWQWDSVGCKWYSVGFQISTATSARKKVDFTVIYAASNVNLIVVKGRLSMQQLRGWKNRDCQVFVTRAAKHTCGTYSKA